MIDLITSLFGVGLFWLCIFWLVVALINKYW
jgi:hypothetical protein